MINRVDYTYGEMRKIAHDYLRQNRTMLFVLGVIAIILGVSSLSLGGLLSVAIVSIIDITMAYVIIKSADKEEITLDDLLNNWKVMAKAYIKYVLVTIGIALGTALITLLGSVLVAVIGMIGVNIMAWMILAFLVAMLWLSIYIEMRLFVLIPVLLHHPEMDIIQSVRYSAELLRGNCLNALGYSLSFVGWILFGILTIGFGLIYVYPLITAGTEVYYRALTSRNVKDDN